MILAAYDFGTTGCKGSFFHEKGALIARHILSIQPIFLILGGSNKNRMIGRKQ